MERLRNISGREAVKAFQKAGWRRLGTTTATATLTPIPAAIPCIGDCSGNGSVTVDEILTSVNNALSACETREE